jgi:hypothetical protein
MRYLVFPLLIVSFVCLATGAEHTNFVGNWRLDTASTPSIDGKQITSATLTIDYRQKMIHLSKTFNFADGNKAVAEEWKMDHKYHPVTSGGTGEFLAKWEGHSVLAAEHEMEGGHENIRLTLSPDLRTLTETIHSTGSSGASDRALVWKRQ